MLLVSRRRVRSVALAVLSAAARDEGRPDLRSRFAKREYRVAMRDGARLFTAVYVPRDAGPGRRYPILLTRTPYSVAPYGEDSFPQQLGPSAAAQKEGFIFVYQDVRGRYLSEGRFEDVRPYREGKGARETDESSDAWDTIDWLLKNVRWNNGRVGVWGISYPGFYAAMSAIGACGETATSAGWASIADMAA